MSEQNNNPTQETEKTFTQQDVDRIVAKRLSEMKTKLEADNAAVLAEKEKDLAKREFQFYAQAELKKHDLPDTMLEALNTTSKESFDKALAILVKDRNRPDIKGGSDISAPAYYGEESMIRNAMGLNKKE